MPKNILFIMTDQQRFDALSLHGGIARTPNLDKLASESVELLQHHSQAPVCVPSRSVIFTGRYPHQLGIYENISRVPESALGLFTGLKEQGYYLGYFGKDHFFPGDSAKLIDDYRHGDPDPEHPRYGELQVLLDQSEHLLKYKGSYASGLFHDLPDELTSTGCTAQAARDFLRNKPKDQPFMAVVSFHDPHVPHLAPRRFKDLQDESSLAIPFEDSEALASKHPRFQIKKKAQGSHLASDAAKRHYLSVYHSMVSYVDEQVGMILKTLEEQGHADDTLVIFTSDHGDFNFDYGMCKKDLVLLDSLLHVPCLLRMPGATPRKLETITEHVDLTPTMLDYVGIQADDTVMGASLLPLLEGESDSHKEASYATICEPGTGNPYPDFDTFMEAWEKHHKDPNHLLGNTMPFNVPGDPSSSIRTRDWRYTLYEDGFEELYDLANDPKQIYNLAKEDRLSEQKAALREQLLAHNEQSFACAMR